MKPIDDEKLLGEFMLTWEIGQICKGERPPLPNTPAVATANSRQDVIDTLKVLYKMYGFIDRDLINKCGDVKRPVANRFMKVWQDIGDEIENTSSL